LTREPRIAVVGAGSWGTTVAATTCRNVHTVLWARRPEVAEAIDADRIHPDYLARARLPEALRATADLEEAVRDADVVVMAVPSHGFREVLLNVAEHARPWIPIVSLTKGLEQDTRRRMTEVIDDVLPGHPAGVLTGPNIAAEVLRGYAAAAVVAMPDEHVARALQRLFRTPTFRVYTSTDVAGAELGGALKNVYAIASGMAQGLGAGENTRGALISRALRELTVLGEALGGRAETFAGLAGLGDMLATCLSEHSRNRTVGERLACGEALEDIVADMHMVAEGTRTAGVVMKLAEETSIELPIAAEVHGVLTGSRTPEQAFRGLLRRRPTTELMPG
jgi:glycerol-3-phosphate dehydrogenase (NAD(P)+)